jgi:hypothetical protein
VTESSIQPPSVALVEGSGGDVRQQQVELPVDHQVDRIGAP